MRISLVSIQSEDRLFVTRCSELGVIAYGETLEEAQANIKEALESYIESFSKDLPHETSRPFRTTVAYA